MKRTYLCIVTMLFGLHLFATDFSSLADATFKNAEDCKQAEPQVLECAQYIFSTPFNKDDINRLTALQYIIGWMSATPSYTFSLDKPAMDAVKGNKDLLGYYMAAMCKTVLSNPDVKKTNQQVYEESVVQLIDFASNKKNNIKMTKGLKKLQSEK